MLPASGEECGALQRAVGAEVGGLKLAAISPAEAARQRRASCRVWPGVGGLKGQPAAESQAPGLAWECQASRRHQARALRSAGGELARCQGDHFDPCGVAAAASVRAWSSS